MQNQTIIDRAGETETKTVTAAQINMFAMEIGQISLDLLDAGRQMIKKGVELGRLLEVKKAEVDRVGQVTWTRWRAEHLQFSERSERNYRTLYKHRQRVAAALEVEEIASLRQALNLLAADNKEESGGEKKEERKTLSKVRQAIAGFWKAFSQQPPEKWQREERDEFLIDLAKRERIRRERGWELPEIEIGVEKL